MKLREQLSFVLRDVLWWLIKILLGPLLRWYFHTQSQGKENFPPRGKPAFLLANHTNAADPFMIADLINKPIRYVISDEYYRYRVTRKLLQMLKGIPKTKNVPDSVTMRMLLGAVKEGELIGVFPEGARNWDGETIPLEDTIPRLVSKLKIPVICIRQRGSYLSWPRWSNLPRRGRVLFSFSYLFKEPEQVPDSTEGIKKQIEAELLYSELEDPWVTSNLYDSSKVAEHVERRLWLCPQCGSFFTLQSSGRLLYCTKCKAKWEFRGNGTFLLKRWGKPLARGAKNFWRYLDWAHYNDSQTLRIIEDMRKRGEDKLVSLPAMMWAAQSETTRERAFRPAGKGIASLSRDFRMIFTPDNQAMTGFEVALKDIRGANVAWNQKFEFFYEGHAYRFTFFGQSAYFWHFLTKHLKAEER